MVHLMVGPYLRFLSCRGRAPAAVVFTANGRGIGCLGMIDRQLRDGAQLLELGGGRGGRHAGGGTGDWCCCSPGLVRLPGPGVGKAAGRQ